MRVEEDFGEYAAARWRHLVYSGILLGCSPHEAEDLAQVTLVKCFAAWHRVLGADNPDAYVSAVLLNAFRESRRRRWRGERPTHPLPDRAEADRTAEVDCVDAVERALGRLNPGQREVVVLRFWTRLSEREIADALGVRVGTVKSRVSRALARLADDADLLELVAGGPA